MALSGLKKITKKMGASSKMIKILHIAIDTKKNIEKGELKMKSIRKIWQQKVIATRIEPTTTYFVNEHATI